MRYDIERRFSELGTVFHVVDNGAPTEDMPAIVGSYNTARYGQNARLLAESLRDELNYETGGLNYDFA